MVSAQHPFSYIYIFIFSIDIRLLVVMITLYYNRDTLTRTKSTFPSYFVFTGLISASCRMWIDIEREGGGL
jgi:hypothetical protein